MASRIQICNFALARIGQSQMIHSLTEKSEAARKCLLFFDQCKDAVLADFPWPFATKSQALADIGSPPANWEYRYRYPQDCLMARRIVPPGDPAEGGRIPFEIASDPDGRVILTRQGAAGLEYTCQVGDTGHLNPLFASALAYKLAIELAMPVTGKPEMAQLMTNAYLAELSRARTQAFNEGHEDSAPRDDFVSSYTARITSNG